ncbi:MAG: hypothetical protein GZ091_00525 [Paludibacter sp.]|nr:hypothetical protein [Paludibacter sp.]
MSGKIAYQSKGYDKLPVNLTLSNGFYIVEARNENGVIHRTKICIQQ